MDASRATASLKKLRRSQQPAPPLADAGPTELGALGVDADRAAASLKRLRYGRQALATGERDVGAWRAAGRGRGRHTRPPQPPHAGALSVAVERGRGRGRAQTSEVEATSSRGDARASASAGVSHEETSGFTSVDEALRQRAAAGATRLPGDAPLLEERRVHVGKDGAPDGGAFTRGQFVAMFGSTAEWERAIVAAGEER